MLNLSEIRRANGRHYIKQAGGSKHVSELLGYRNPGYMSQLFGPNPQRSVTEKVARRIEEGLGLPRGALDDENTAAVAASDEWATTRVRNPEQAPAASEAAKRNPSVSGEITHYQEINADTAEMVRSVINLVGEIIQKEKVDLSAIKALQLVDMGVSDAMEHGGQPREQHLLSLVRLVGK